jgi:IS5 family transposase
MKQLTLAAVGFERYSKTTRRAAFLSEMEQVVPWSALCGLIEPFYPKPGNGRPPVGVERMLRIYFLQQWFDLSDPAVEEALYDSLAMRRFVGIDLGREPVPDETTVCRFRHLLEEHDLGRQLFEEVQRHLAAKGMKVATGTIVDATIINAPSSTKNADKARDPEMHQTKKGNQWYFGMKAHFGVDSRTKLIYAVAATPANVADSTVLPELLHGNETRVWGDQAYRGDPGACAQGAGFHQSPLPPRRCCRSGRAGEKPHQVQSAGEGRACDRGHQAGVRLCKVRYRGLNKNLHRLVVTCALANLFMARRHLSRGQPA